MYGSSFQLEQAINSKKFQAAELRQSYQNTGREKRPLFIILVLLTMALLSISTVSMAGSKQPKIAGGNGNANGR